MANKFLIFDEVALTTHIKGDLTKEERRKLVRALRDMNEQVRGYIENHVIPKDIINKVKITIQ